MQRILIIEDEELMRQGLAELLQSSGYEPISLELETNLTPSLESLTEQILQKQPHLILLDINLPGINGEM